MANKGLNKMRVWAGDVPNIGSVSSSSCNQLAIKRETAVLSPMTGHMEFSHNCSGIKSLNCNNILIAQSKLSVIWGESNVGTIICRGDLVTIDIPMLDFAPRYRYDVLRVHGREANMLYNTLLLYGTKGLPCLNVPQTNCVIRWEVACIRK